MRDGRDLSLRVAVLGGGLHVCRACPGQREQTGQGCWASSVLSVVRAGVIWPLGRMRHECVRRGSLDSRIGLGDDEWRDGSIAPREWRYAGPRVKAGMARRDGHGPSLRVWHYRGSSGRARGRRICAEERFSKGSWIERGKHLGIGDIRLRGMIPRAWAGLCGEGFSRCRIGPGRTGAVGPAPSSRGRALP